MDRRASNKGNITMDNTKLSPESRALARMAIAKSPAVILKWAAVAWPAAFGKPVPLKLKISRDMAQAIPNAPRYCGHDNWNRDKVNGVVAAALAAWTRQDTYLVELQVGAPRIDLNGQVAGVVSEREKAHAIELLDEIDKHGAPKSWNLEPWNVAAARRLWRSLTRSNNVS
jgi:sRNA-binding protein